MLIFWSYTVNAESYIYSIIKYSLKLEFLNVYIVYLMTIVIYSTNLLAQFLLNKENLKTRIS